MTAAGFQCGKEISVVYRLQSQLGKEKSKVREPGFWFALFNFMDLGDALACQAR